MVADNHLELGATVEEMEFESIQLGLDEAKLWAFSLKQNEEYVAELEQLCSADEISRANRFVTEELRQRFIVARGTLRQMLSAATDLPANEIQFRYEQWGKPQLLDCGSSPRPVHFNVSHSADVALIGVSSEAIGVDIECPSTRVNCRAISSQVVSPAEDHVWKRTPAKDHDQLIMRLWVCKEAILKAMGLGIAEGLQKISFPMPISDSDAFCALEIDPSLQLHLDEDGNCLMNSWTDPSTWRVQLINELPHCYAAVTTQRHIHRITLENFLV